MMTMMGCNNNSNNNGGQFGDTTLTKVFVGGLAWETPKDTLREHFEKYGEILEAVIISDKITGRSKGYGFDLVTGKMIAVAKERGGLYYLVAKRSDEPPGPKHDRTKHIEIDRHFIKKKLDSGLITTVYISSMHQLTNVLTKGLPTELFSQFTCKLGTIDIHSPA